MVFLLSCFCRKECMGEHILCVCVTRFIVSMTLPFRTCPFFVLLSPPPRSTFPLSRPFFITLFSGNHCRLVCSSEYTVSSRCLRNEGSSSSSFLQFTSFCNCCLLVPKAACQVLPPPEHRGGTIQN